MRAPQEMVTFMGFTVTTERVTVPVGKVMAVHETLEVGPCPTPFQAETLKDWETPDG